MATELPLGLVALPHGVEDIVEMAGVYHVIYHPVTVTDTQKRRHTIGPIRVEIRPPENQYRVATLKGFLPEGQTHPHILRGTGDICLGNYRGGIMTAINEGLWVTAIVLLGEILDSYNPKDCYHRLEAPVACTFCQRPEVPQLVRCTDCNTRLCSDCRHPTLLLCPRCIVSCLSCLQPMERPYHRDETYCPDCIAGVYGHQRHYALHWLLPEIGAGFALALDGQWGVSPSLRTKTAWQEHYQRFHGREPNEWAIMHLIPSLPKARIIAEVVPPTMTLTQALQEAEEGLLFEDDAIERAASLSRSALPLLANIRQGRYFLGQILTPAQRVEYPDTTALRTTLAQRLQLACLYQWKERHP